jgi:hypothetical protein
MTEPAATHDVTDRSTMNAPSPVTRRFALSGPITLDCRLGYGSLTVHAQDAVAEATVVLTPRDPNSDVVAATTVQLAGRTLVIRVPKPHYAVFELPLFGAGRSDRDALDVDVTIPSGTPLKVMSLGADVTVEGRTGTADIASGSNTITLGRVDGDLRLRYGSGQATIAQVSGTAVVKSGSGAVSFGEVGGADVACGTGTLTVDVARGTVRMRTGAGDAHIGVAEGDVDLVSGSGGLSVGLRAGHAARLDITSGSGRVESDLPIGEAPPPSGSRAITIRARTGSGTVRLFRAA